MWERTMLLLYLSARKNISSILLTSVVGGGGLWIKLIKVRLTGEKAYKV